MFDDVGTELGSKDIHTSVYVSEDPRARSRFIMVIIGLHIEVP
jgi:hypothetical protein